MAHSASIGRTSPGLSTHPPPCVALSPAGSTQALRHHTCRSGPGTAHPACPPHGCLLRRHLQGALPDPRPHPCHQASCSGPGSALGEFSTLSLAACRPLGAPRYAVSLAAGSCSLSPRGAEPPRGGCEARSRDLSRCQRPAPGGGLCPHGRGQGPPIPLRAPLLPSDSVVFPPTRPLVCREGASRFGIRTQPYGPWRRPRHSLGWPEPGFPVHRAPGLGWGRCRSGDLSHRSGDSWPHPGTGHLCLNPFHLSGRLASVSSSPGLWGGPRR